MSNALTEAQEVLKAWDDFCSRHPEKYPSDETIKQRELLHSILCIRCVQAVRELSTKETPFTLSLPERNND